MKRLQSVANDPGYKLFYCPGCEAPHGITVNGYKNDRGAGWQWNGSEEAPTFSPSVRVFDDQGTICHSFINNGQIQFLGDCRHILKNQTVPIPDWDTAMTAYFEDSPPEVRKV